MTDLILIHRALPRDKNLIYLNNSEATVMTTMILMIIAINMLSRKNNRMNKKKLKKILINKTKAKVIVTIPVMLPKRNCKALLKLGNPNKLIFNK